ncbi:MAG: hypothetical protein QXG46_02585 [Ignisphaera sp.]
MFCHIGLGKAYERSYEFFLSSVVTSSGAKKKYIDIVRIEGFLGYPYRLLIEKFRNNIIHSYRYSHRQYYVFPQEFYTLFVSFFKLLNNLYRLYKRDLDRVFRRIENIINYCENIEKCYKKLLDENYSVAEEIVKKIQKGRKALTTRLERNTKRCIDKALTYFPEILNMYTYRYRSPENLKEFLLKIFPERIARAYHDFIIMHNPVVVARDELILIARDSYDEFDSFRIYIDDCVDKEHYFLLKMVGTLTLNGYVSRIKWVALLGYDKNSNQIFLHYVPSTMVLYNVEKCRLWLLGLVDSFGREFFSNFELIEV